MSNHEGGRFYAEVEVGVSDIGEVYMKDIQADHCIWSPDDAKKLGVLLITCARKARELKVGAA